jgi:hypothetical protein
VLATLVVGGCDAATGAAFTRASSNRGAGGAPVATQGAPCDEGEARPCHVARRSKAGVTSCFVGVAVCHEGVLGACGEVDPGAPTPLGASFTPGPAGACVDDPCDPWCLQFVDAPDGGVAADAGAVGGSFEGGAVGSLPGGFENKGLKDASHPPKSPCTGASDCQFDHRCVAGNCVPWGPGETDPGCAGIDLTAGVPCDGLVPVCNRGNTTAPAGVKIGVLNGNSAQLQGNLGRCSGLAGTLAGSCATTTTIPPGECVAVAGCPLGNGTRSLVVNPPAGLGVGAPVAECACGDNWTVGPGGACPAQTPPLVTTTVTEAYVATCPPGARPAWGWLAWSATVPSNASGAARVTLRGHTAASVTELAPGCADYATFGDVPSASPASCPMSGPAPCPVDLSAALGPVRARDAALELVITLDPTPDGAVGPSVASWKVTYSCVPSE